MLERVVSPAKSASSRARPLPTVSIIVSTLNRLTYLRRLIDALGHLEDDDVELVIVNGPSTDGTAAFLAEWAGPAKMITCPTANLSRSRNLGVAAATGDILVFIDDDALPAKADWLRKYRSFFADGQNGSFAAAGGEVVNAHDGSVEFYRGSTSEFAEQSPQDGSVFRPASGGWTVRGVMGCNFAVRARALRAVGGFDENISYYLDETDLCFRLFERGFDIGFIEDAVVIHAAGPSDFRRSHVRKNWRVLSRSDTYFCIKNSRATLIQKLLQIANTGGSKHFFYVYRKKLPRPEIGRWRALRAYAASCAGIAEGLWRGLFRPRRLLAPGIDPGERIVFRPVRPVRKLRIGLISRTLPGAGNYGGPGQHTEALANGLYGLGHEVHLIVRPEQPVPRVGIDYAIHARPHLLVGESCYDLELPSTSLRLAEAADYRRAVEDLDNAGKPLDFVIACNWDLEALAIIRAGICPVALFLVTPLAMNLELGTFPSNEDNFLWNSLDRHQALAADLPCAPSHAVMDVYRDLLGTPVSSFRNLAVIPLGIERTHLPAMARSGKKKLLFVGRLEKRKGIHTLLAALPAILDEFRDWECHIVGFDKLLFGDGPPIKNRFLRLHGGERWMSRVFFHGFQSQKALHDHYRGCDLFVVPALYESFGLAYHEAMQYGKAVIACRAGGMVDTVEEDIEGLLAEPDDVESLAAKMRLLMRDDALRQRMGAAGADRIRFRDNHLTFARTMERALLDHLDKRVASKSAGQKAPAASAALSRPARPTRRRERSP